MFLVKAVALIIVLAVTVPLVAGDSAVGQLFRAAWSDIAGFCTRQPEACAEGVALARDAGSLIADTLHELGSGADEGTLTAEDLRLAPATPAGPAPHSALAGHGAVARP